MKTVLLFLALSLTLYSQSYSQCIYGDCKNGYGRLKDDNLLYCGNFTSKKLNGEVFIYEFFEKIIDPNWQYNQNHGISQKLQKQEKYLDKWLPICVVNYENGKSLSKGKYLFRYPLLNNFNADLREYLEYFEGEIDKDLNPHGVGNIYTENIYTSRGQKQLLGDSVVYDHGKIVFAKSYNQQNGDGTQGIYYNATFDDLPWKAIEKEANWKGIQNKALRLENYNIIGNMKVYYDSPTNKLLARETNVIRKCTTLNYAIRERNKFELQNTGYTKLYTPNGTMVYEGEAEYNQPKDKTLKIKKCISGNCTNGISKMILNMPIGETSMWYANGNPKREKIRTFNNICVFEGRFKDGKPVGTFKMWSTYGYDFTGQLNDDFSLKSGKLVEINSDRKVIYQGNFGTESEMMDGVIEGPWGRFRITKEREWLKE